jgi:hypothetical protein
MNEVLHANIFFFVTGIAVIVCTAILCVLLIHGIKLLKSVRRIIDRIDAETEEIAEDMQSVRAYFREGGILQRLFVKLVGTLTYATPRQQKAKGQGKNKLELKIKDET